MRIAAAQDAPVFLDRAATTEKILGWIEAAAAEEVKVLGFGETFLPGYPFWMEYTDGARFDDPGQKEAYRAYLDAAVRIDGPELAEIAGAAAVHGIYVVLGVAERGTGAGSGSIWCTAVSMHPERGILPVHRKLVPTFEERLAWAHGDGHGLNGHDFAGVRIGALNCWENWMPLARYALYAEGVGLHVALWPGSVGSTQDITRFIAREGRMFVLSAGGLMQRSDIPAGFPLRDALPADDWFRNGGSAIASPTGDWLVPPVARERRLVIADLDLATIARERHNFDPTGHYARPDVFRLDVDRTPRRPVYFKD